MKRRGWTIVLLLLCGAACDGASDGDAGVPDAGDAGADTALPDLPFEIALPAEPAEPAAPADVDAPDFGTCPSGFRAIVREGVDVCDPYPETPPECAGAEALFAGETACAPVGPACPSGGPFPEGLPAGASVVYALAGAAAGGDGSEARPFATINEALAAATVGGIVAIGEGTYAERLVLDANVTLWGACAGSTVLAPPAGTRAPAIAVQGRSAVVRGLRIEGGGHVGVAVTSAGTAELDGVVIAGVERVGIGVYQRSSLTASDVVVRDTTSSSVDGRFGTAVAFEGGSTGELSRVVLERNQYLGIHSDGTGTEWTASRLVVRDTTGQTVDGGFGTAINVQNGAVATVRESLFDGNRNVSALSSGPGAHLTLEDVVVRNSQPEERRDNGGMGIAANLDAVIDVRRTLVESSFTAGIGVFSGATGTLEDVVVVDTSSQPADGILGPGIVEENAALDATRVVVARSRMMGVLATAGTATLTDVVARDSEGEEDSGALGCGIGLFGADVSVTRGAFEGNHFAGAVAYGESSVLTLSDVTIRDTRSDASDGSGGFGIYLAEGATVNGARLRLENNRTAGALATGGSRMELEDLFVADTQFEEGTGWFGYGVVAELDAAVVLRRARVERSRSLAVIAHGGATMQAEDIHVAEMLADEVGHGGAGLVVASDGDLRVTRARVERARHAGVVATERGTYAIEDLTVVDTLSTEVDSLVGYGISVGGASAGSIARGIIDLSTTMGVIVDGEGTSLTIDDFVVRDTRATEAPESLGEEGRGIDVQYGASVEGSRVLLEGNREVSLYAFGAGTTVTLSDVAILDTQPRACAVDTCPDDPLGVGVAPLANAHITLERFTIARASLCGAHISAGGELDLRDGEVTESLIGICLAEDYDTSRLMQDVAYRDNGANLDAPSLTVPAAMEAEIFAPR